MLPNQDEGVSIAPGLQFVLPQWSRPERAVEATQMLSGRFGEQTFSLYVRLSLNDQRLKAVGFDALGRRAFDIVWSGEGVVASRASWLPQSVKAQNVLADMILAFWPLSVVEPALVGGAPSAHDWKGKREVTIGVKKAVVVSYETDRQQAWNQQVQITNMAFDYELMIQSAEVKP